MPMKCSLLPRPVAHRAGRLAAPRRRSGARRRALPGIAEATDIAARRGSSPSSAPSSAASRAGAHLRVLDHGRRARLGHPGGVGALVVGGRVRIGDEERRPPGGGDLEDRAARAPEDQVAGGEAVAEVGLVLEQRVALLIRSGLEPGRQLAVVAPPGEVDRRGSRGPARSARASSAQSLIERAPWLPPITSRQRSSAATPKRGRAPSRSAASTAAGTGLPVTR